MQPEHSASYTFDAIGRLTAVSGGDSSWGIAWTLDRHGNRTTQTPTGLASSRLGSPSLTYTDNKVSGLGYDAAGNMTNDGVGGHTYTYDAENRLVQVDSSAIQYAYDYAGRRIKKTVSGVSTYQFYGLTGLTSEFSTGTSGASGAAPTDRIQYRVGEQTGTAVMLVDPDGTPRENNRVFPFGEPWLAFVASNNNEKFTTYQHDNDDGTDLDYAMARYYASRLGRFMTADPGHVGANVGDPQSWNAYVYSRNDPINLVDPSGLMYGEPSCYLDGIPTDCDLAMRLLYNGAAEQCPYNVCEAVNEYNLPVKYQVTTQGSYYAPLLPGVWSTAMEAGVAAVGSTNERSVVTGLELIGNVYRLPNGKYSWTLPQEGSAHQAAWDPDNIPFGTTYAGEYHDHGAFDPDYDGERFSMGDWGGCVSERGNNQLCFLGTPSGRTLLLDPNQQLRYLFTGCVLVGSEIPAGAGPRQRRVPICRSPETGRRLEIR